MNSQAPVDLQQLAVDRSISAVKPRSSRPKWASRYAFPLIVLGGFALLIAWAAKDSLLPSTDVTVVPVIVSRSETTTENESLFQAAGWIEPRPTPIVVTALFEGVVDRLVVVEGQEVKAGEPLAYLIDGLARLGQLEANASVELRRAELASAEATLTASRVNFEQPVQRLAALAEAEAQLAKIETELGRIPFQIRVQESRREFARLDLEGKTVAQDSVARRTLLRSRSDFEIAAATEQELQKQSKLLEKEKAALKRRSDALHRQWELKNEESRSLGEAKANVDASRARLTQAEIAVEHAALRMKHAVIYAPVAGRVLSLVARPGSRLMGMERGTLQDASTVITMYKPDQLQIRADVRLEDLPRVTPGQKVRIETAAVAGWLTGAVLSLTSLADIQKNTLQVKVAVDRPPAVIKPDMLVQVTFLAPLNPNSDGNESQPLRLLAPRALIEGEKEQAKVWVVDQQAGVARLRNIRLGLPTGNGLVHVPAGLSVGDRIISGGRQGLTEGQRIRVTSEDSTFGLSEPGN